MATLHFGESKMTVKYLLGVDAGGTSTTYRLYDFPGNILSEFTGPSIHFMQYDKETIQKRLGEAKAFFEKNFSFEEIFVAMGIGGYGQDPKVRAYIESMVLPIFPNAVLKSDAEFAMISALQGEDGIYVISGTGSIAFRKDGNELSRQGGFGYLLADEGSGFWIGRELLKQFTQEADMRHSRTDLYDFMMEHFNLSSPYDLIAIVSSKKEDYRHWVASLSGLCFEIEGARAIYEKAGYELAQLVNGFQTSEKTKVACGGSVLNKNQVVFESFEKHLNDNYEIIKSKEDVEWAVSYIYKSLKLC